jgi:hypothetical protein
MEHSLLMLICRENSIVAPSFVYSCLYRLPSEDQSSAVIILSLDKQFSLCST